MLASIMVMTSIGMRRFVVFSLIILLLVLAFIVIKPIFMSIASGLLLAYIFLPLYKRANKIIKEKNTASLVICALLILIVIVPLWFIIPLAIKQTFDFFNVVQGINIKSTIEKIFLTSDLQFQQEVTTSIITFVGKVTTSSLNALINLFLDLPSILLHVAVVLFVFFFTMRDHEKLKKYISELSPIKKEKEQILSNNFRAITSSIVYGYVITGLIQGLATGIGLFIFGVPRALILTLFAIFASIFPLFGPWLVWVPVAIYLFIKGNTAVAIGFTLYSALFVSLIDNFLRPYIVSRRTGISPVIVLVGMIGGLLVFGILGILFGPLILSYLILLLTAYKDKTLSEMFDKE